LEEKYLSHFEFEALGLFLSLNSRGYVFAVILWEAKKSILKCCNTQRLGSWEFMKFMVLGIGFEGHFPRQGREISTLVFLEFPLMFDKGSKAPFISPLCPPFISPLCPTFKNFGKYISNINILISSFLKYSNIYVKSIQDLKIWKFKHFEYMCFVIVITFF
jgi:hypothetical protein